MKKKLKPHKQMHIITHRGQAILRFSDAETAARIYAAASPCILHLGIRAIKAAG